MTTHNMPPVLAVLHEQQKRQRRAKLRLRAAERARRIGEHHAVARALVPLHNCGDSLNAFDRNLAANHSADDSASRAFALARRLIHDHNLILTGGSL